MRKNPVDTGRSRAGWYVAIEKLGGTVSGISSSGVDEGRRRGRFIDHTKGFTDKWVEMINGVDYIIYLEYGRSNQAPYGMVRVSMRELRRGKLPKDMAKQIKKDWNSFYY